MSKSPAIKGLQKDVVIYATRGCLTGNKWWPVIPLYNNNTGIKAKHV